MSIRIATLCAALLAGCSGQEAREAAPPPAQISEDAIGYYCRMNVIEHAGPKAQIFIKGEDEPLWFSQARDGVVFTRLPEETAEITAFYVTDMGRVSDWRAERDFAWIPAADAYFVIESARTGGMGAPETVPFGELADAERYRAENGGRIVSLESIPDQYVLGPAPDMNAHNGDMH
jgi:copper chaperone NosL